MCAWSAKPKRDATSDHFGRRIPSAAVTALVDAVNRFDETLEDRVSAPILGTTSYAELGSAEVWARRREAYPGSPGSQMNLTASELRSTTAAVA